jgi:hypothetical protein
MVETLYTSWDKPYLNWCRISQPSTVCCISPVAGSGKYGDFEHFLGEAELLNFAVSHSPAAMDRSDFLDHLQMKRVGQLDIHCLIKRVALTKGLV